MNSIAQVGKQWQALIVDDDAFVCSVMREMLNNLGASKVEVAGNGKVATNMLMAAKQAPDLIFCDLHMPGKDGFQFMEELAQRNFLGGVVLISGQREYVLHSGELMARFHQLNFLAALEKPVSVEQLQAVIAKLII